jgi:effector-binding domain-containing protein
VQGREGKMAINSFDDILASIKDPEKLRVFKEVVETDVPEAKGGWLRQADYSKHMNSLANDKKLFEAEKAEKQAELAKLEEWKSWRVSSWDDEHQMTKSEVKKLAQITDLTAELEILKAAQEAGMTFDEVGQYLDKELSKKNLVSKDYLDKEFRKELVDRKAFDSELNTRVGGVANGMEYLYDSTLPAVLAHKDEFGEVIKPSEIIKYANENGYKKIEDAYERMIAPKRAEIQAKKNEEALKKAREEGEKAGEEKAKAERMAALAQGGRTPVDDGPPVMGHMERKLRMNKDKTTNDIPEDAKLGTLSNMVAEKYRREKADGTSESVVSQYARPA